MSLTHDHASCNVIYFRFRAYRTLDELREATDSPSPLTEILQDPATLRSLINGHHASSSKKTRRPSLSGTRKESHSSSTSSTSAPAVPRKKDRGHGRDRDRDHRGRDRERDTASLLTIVLAEEERQAHHLKALLRTTAERLEMEMRRGDQAERRAYQAESQARESATRATIAETSKHQAELDLAHARSEITKYKLQAETSDRDFKKADNELARMSRVREDLERSLAEAKDAFRKAQHSLREWQAREEGRDEGRRSEVVRRYNDGREDGYEDGKNEGYEAGHAEGYDEGHTDGFTKGRQEGHNAGRFSGYEEGKKVGYDEGYAEGLERGRKEERENALRAFDKFIDRELEKRSMTSLSSVRTDNMFFCLSRLYY